MRVDTRIAVGLNYQTLIVHRMYGPLEQILLNVPSLPIRPGFRRRSVEQIGPDGLQIIDEELLIANAST